MAKRCACGSAIAYKDCCGLFHKHYNAPTALQLMKSRYVAFTKGNVAYIEKTMRGKALLGFNPTETHKWATSVTWLNLKIVTAYTSPDNANIAYVELIAKYRERNTVQMIHELSEFHFIDGQWFYMNGSYLSV